MTLAFRERTDVTSWGRVIRRPQTVAEPVFSSELKTWAASDGGPRLAAGLRRSYGDTNLFSDGRMILTPLLDRMISFDPASGLLRAEAGLSLDDLLRVVAPLGWFVPVTPGTRRVTLGGAVANDVHGKNHSRAGTFGRHVQALTLLRSDRGVVALSRDREPELFAATVGGLGLTGIILDVTLQLSAIASTSLDVETFPLGNLDDFFALNAESLALCEQTVAWVDCTQRGAKAGMGVYTRANWAKHGALTAHSSGAKTVPLETPGFLINPLSLALFNTAYRTAQLLKPRRAQAHYSSFFHPLDSIEEWNKLYGAAGFYQYQLVVPFADGRTVLGEVLDIIGRSGDGSALMVLKTFGDLPAEGLLSFPRPGYTLALDFKNRGQPMLDLLGRLDSVVREAGGTLYPAKDGRLPRAMFEAGYPQFERFLTFRDPACGSDFLTRMST
ncbi:FAD-binding oxidoreductase [soil metagenome]